MYCPFCFSESLRKYGWNIYKGAQRQRWICNKCEGVTIQPLKRRPRRRPRKYKAGSKQPKISNPIYRVILDNAQNTPHINIIDNDDIIQTQISFCTEDVLINNKPLYKYPKEDNIYIHPIAEIVDKGD